MRLSEKILHQLQPMSLPELDAVALMKRVDSKYIFPIERLPHLLQCVSDDYRVLNVDGVCASAYRNLYFDSPDRICYRQHHNGKWNRRKIRVREYIESGCCYVEVKTKNNKGETEKQRMEIRGVEERLSEESTAFVASVTGSYCEFLPQLWSYFSRITLVDRHLTERITLDTNLMFRHPGQIAEARVSEIVIAEVKQRRDDRTCPFRMRLREQGIRPRRVSKYCLGTLLLHPGVKYNRFKRNLLAICKLSGYPDACSERMRYGRL